MNTKVTVIVPAFNEEQTIQRCIESLLNQTIVPNIIVVNDGSTDKTLEVLLKYKHLNNFLVIDQANQGVSAARNHGIIASKTDLITFLDADDYVEKSFIQTLLSGYLRYKDINLSVCNYSIKNQQDTVSYGKFKTGVVNQNTYFGSIISDNGANGFVYNKMFRKSVIEKYNVWFNTQIAIGEDFLFCFLYGRYCNKIYFNNSVQVHYLPTNSGISDTMQIKGRFSVKIFDYFFANLEIIKFLTFLDSNEYINSLINKEIYRTSMAATTIIRKVYLYNQTKYFNNLEQLKKFLKDNFWTIMKSNEVNSSDKLKIFLSIYLPSLLKQIDKVKVG